MATVAIVCAHNSSEGMGEFRVEKSTAQFIGILNSSSFHVVATVNVHAVILGT